MQTRLGKIAVIITGELRTWSVAKKYIFNYFDQFDTPVDFYFVTWSESSEYWFNKHGRISKINEQEIRENFVGRNLIQLKIEEPLPDRNNTSIFLLKAHLSKIANILKRRYEFDNNFIYDHVIEIRPDLFITPSNRDKVVCKNFEIILDEIFYDYYLLNNVPLLPDLYFRTTSMGHDIMSTRNTHGQFKDLDRLTDLRRRGFEFDPMLSSRDVHFMLYDFISQRRLLPVYKVKNEVEDIMVIRPNVPDKQDFYTADEIRQYYNEYLTSLAL